MTAIQIPVGMSDEQIATYMKRVLKKTSQANIIRKDASDYIPPEPEFRNTVEIQGDDWTTDTKGMSGKSLKKIIHKMKKA